MGKLRRLTDDPARYATSRVDRTSRAIENIEADSIISDTRRSGSDREDFWASQRARDTPPIIAKQCCRPMTAATRNGVSSFLAKKGILRVDLAQGTVGRHRAPQS